jgi:hypothetical protein
MDVFGKISIFGRQREMAFEKKNGIPLYTIIPAGSCVI